MEQVQQEAAPAVKQAGPHLRLLELHSVGKHFPYALWNEPIESSGVSKVLQETEF